jgi:hypothetical protein
MKALLTLHDTFQAGMNPSLCVMHSVASRVSASGTSGSGPTFLISAQTTPILLTLPVLSALFNLALHLTCKDYSMTRCI